MSKKKSKTKVDKQNTKHDFSHLLKTKAAAKMVAAETEINVESVNPINKQINRDLKVGLIVIALFVALIVIFWLFLGRNGELLKFTDNIKFY